MISDEANEPLHPDIDLFSNMSILFLPELSGVEAAEIDIRGTIGGSKGITKPPEEAKPGVSGRKEEYAKPKTNEIELNRLPHLGNGNIHQTYIGEYVSLVSLFLIVWRWIKHKQKLGIRQK